MSTSKNLRVSLSEPSHRRLHAFAKAHRLSTAEAVDAMLQLAVSVLSPPLTQYVEAAAVSEGPLPRPPERAAWVFGEAAREAARQRSGYVVMTVDALARLTADLTHHKARIPELMNEASRHENRARIEHLRATYWLRVWECYQASQAGNDDEGRRLARERDRALANLAEYNAEP